MEDLLSIMVINFLYSIINLPILSSIGNIFIHFERSDEQYLTPIEKKMATSEIK